MLLILASTFGSGAVLSKFSNFGGLGPWGRRPTLAVARGGGRSSAWSTRWLSKVRAGLGLRRGSVIGIHLPVNHYRREITGKPPGRLRRGGGAP